MLGIEETLVDQFAKVIIMFHTLKENRIETKATKSCIGCRK